MAGIIAILMCALMLMGVFAALPAETEAASTDGWIEGYVTDGATPIQNAYILYFMLIGGGGPMGSTLTDGTGHYNLTVIGGIEYMVIAFEGDYYAANGSAFPDIGETAMLDLTMVPIAPLVADVTIQGYVKDEGGNPVTGGNVAGYVNDPSSMGQGAPAYANMTTPDITGYYSVNVIAGSAGGGAAALDFPGYPFSDNSTLDPFVSGETYWINLTLSVQSYTDDAVVYGNVTDSSTGLPIQSVLVLVQSENSWNTPQGYSNYTFTDSAGYYQFNVTNGTSRIWFQTSGYSMFQVEDLPIGPGDSISVDADLVPTNAVVSGNVTDLKTSLPIANARIFLMDGGSHFVMAVTNASGGYTLDAFNGTDLMIGAEQDGYGRNMSIITILPGDHLWMDFALPPLDAWLTGKVTDALNGTPIADAGVWVYSPSYSNWVSTDSAGDYNVTLISDNYTVDVNAADYRSNSSAITVVPGGNVLNISMLPWVLPQTTRLYGWINDSGSGTGLLNATMQIGLAPPESGEQNQTLSNDTGYYEMWVPPLLIQFVSYASDHEHAEGIIDATGLPELRLDVSLVADTWSPNVTYSVSPTQNISGLNPSWIDVTFQESDPQNLALSQFIYLNTSGGISNYYLIEMLFDSFNPLSYGPNNLPFLQVGDVYTISHPWAAEVTGGWLKSGATQQYFGAFEMSMGPTVYEGLRGWYWNSTLGSSLEGTAWFDKVSGNFVFFSFDGSQEPAYASDATGTFEPDITMMQVNDTNGDWNWLSGMTLGNWSVVGLQFLFDETVPSGKYATNFWVGDFGNHGWANTTLTTVDNDPPAANAGSDQLVSGGDTVLFDGTLSTDNVGVDNYTWTFEYDGSTITLWGPNPTFQFFIDGVYDVNLTVRDGAGQTSTDVVQITVITVIPEFPTMIMPISGMILLFALVWIRRKKSEG